VSGRWTVPTITCTAGSPTWSAMWVGLGGFRSSSGSLEQTGTTEDCTSGGRARYSAWYELVPAPMITLKMRVRPGHEMGASVNVAGTAVTLVLRDFTSGETFRRRFAMSAPDVTSAEWIAEAPSACDGQGFCQVLPLAAFGTVDFSHGRVTTLAGRTGAILDAGWRARAVELRSAGRIAGPPGSVSDTATTLAAPSALSASGGAFSVSALGASGGPVVSGAVRSERAVAVS
jgi:hypothetical protein